MVATSKISDKGKNKSQVTIQELRVSNPTRTMKREKSRKPDARGCYLNSRAIWHVMQNTNGVDIDGIGKVAISFKSGDVLILSNVLYVPTMKINPLSVDKLYNNGYRFHYQGKEVVIKKGRERLGKGYDTCELYRFSINAWPDAIAKLD
ncbi:hypothetical protein Tco_0699049 [Tanacetum coccineum]